MCCQCRPRTTSMTMYPWSRFYAEEAFSFHVQQQLPDTLRVLDMQDMHALRQGEAVRVQQARANVGQLDEGMLWRTRQGLRHDSNIFHRLAACACPYNMPASWQDMRACVTPSLQGAWRCTRQESPCSR